MKAIFTNATVQWTEREIEFRENLMRDIVALLKETWQGMNRAVHFRRCEAPILTPACHLRSHIAEGFELVQTNLEHAGEPIFLRPETTKGTFEVMADMYPQDKQLQKKLPICLWQYGKSFRNEGKGETMRASNLRLREFYQLEFQLFASKGTGAPYLEAALGALQNQYGGGYEKPAPNDLPHYSNKTIDWVMDGVEVAGCSVRKDWEPGMVFEVAIGMDRLTNMLLKGAE